MKSAGLETKPLSGWKQPRLIPGGSAGPWVRRLYTGQCEDERGSLEEEASLLI